MDIQKEFACLERTRLVVKKSLDSENDFQETLPAYCDDIYKVIKCVAKNSISSADINYNEAVVNCRCRIYLTYLNENGSVCFADFEEEYTRSLGVDGLTDGAFIHAFVNDKYTNYRVINQRRIDIHSSATVQIEVFDRTKYPCLSECENAKLKRETIKCCDVIGSVLSKIEFDEEFSVPADVGQIGRIVSFQAYAFVTDTKIIKDKALIKASVTLEVLFTADDAEETLQRAVHSFNVSKIVDVGGIEENDVAITAVDVNNVYLKAKLSQGDKMNMISAFGEVSLNALFVRESTVSVISDGYLLGSASECQTSRFGYFTDGHYANENKTVSMSFDLPDEIREVKEADVHLGVPVFKGNKPVSTVQLHIIGTDNDGALLSYSGTGETELNTEPYADAMAAVGLQSFDYSIAPDGRLELRMNMQVAAYAFNEREMQVLTDVAEGDAKPTFPSLTLYFPKKGETLWDIAKQFCSDVSLIAAENDLDNNVVDGTRPLIIPKILEV